MTAEKLEAEDVLNNMSQKSLLAQGDSPVKVYFVMAAGVLALLAMPVATQAQGVGVGAHEGAHKGAHVGHRVLGPVGGAVGGVVGGVTGGVVGGVKGALGIPQRRHYYHRQPER